MKTADVLPVAVAAVLHAADFRIVVQLFVNKAGNKYVTSKNPVIFITGFFDVKKIIKNNIFLPLTKS